MFDYKQIQKTAKQDYAIGVTEGSRIRLCEGVREEVGKSRDVPVFTDLYAPDKTGFTSGVLSNKHHQGLGVKVRILQINKTSALIGVLEVKINALLGYYDRLDGPTDRSGHREVSLPITNFWKK